MGTKLFVPESTKPSPFGSATVRGANGSKMAVGSFTASDAAQ
jgi:hypothetical protein